MDYLIVREAAKRLSVSIDTIHRWRKGGYFPGARRKGPGKTSAFVIPEKDVTEMERRLGIKTEE